MNINIPFHGFYESKWSMGLDDAEALLAEYLAGEDGEERESYEYAGLDFTKYSKDDITSALYWVTNYHVAHVKIAREYTEHFTLETGVRVKFVEMDSPREYNFTTDRIFCTIPRSEARRMRKAVSLDNLSTVARERHTSRDGFHSFYSPDWQTWGHVDTWDHNQLQTLLVAYMMEDETPDDLEWKIYEEMTGNGFFDSALESAFVASELLAKLEAKQ